MNCKDAFSKSAMSSSFETETRTSTGLGLRMMAKLQQANYPLFVPKKMQKEIKHLQCCVLMHGLVISSSLVKNVLNINYQCCEAQTLNFLK